MENLPGDVRQREELKTSLISGFAARDEIYAIHLFGRDYAGDADQYSDIDVVICSNDPHQTQAEIYSVIEVISPIRKSLILCSTPNHYAESIMLMNFSPYQKIDLSVVPHIQLKSEFGPFRRVYGDQDTGVMKPASLMEVVEDEMTIEARLDDVLFSIPRFTKCVFRNDLDMYRRWKGTTDLLLVVLYEKHKGKSSQNRYRLKAHETHFLYRIIDKAEKQSLECVLPSSGEVDIVASYWAAVEWLVDLLEHEAKQKEVDLDIDFAEFMLDWLADEAHRAGR